MNRVTLIKKRIIACLLSIAMIMPTIPASASTQVTGTEESGKIQYEPLSIATNSLNANAVWGETEEWNSSEITLDTYAAFYAEGRNSEGGFPDDGKLTVGDVKYALANGEDTTKAYDGNDCIRLTNDESSTMNLDTIGVYDSVYVLATAGGPGTNNFAIFDVTLSYTDGTTDTTTYNLYDWWDNRTGNVNNAVPIISYPGMMRCNYSSYFQRMNYEVSTTTQPYLHSAKISVDSSKLLTSIKFTLAGQGADGGTTPGTGTLYCGIFAVTGATPEGVLDAPVATAATKIEGDTSGEFTANWNEVEGATSYRLDVATDRKFTSILDDYNNKDVGTANSQAITGAAINATTTYYYRVRAVNNKGQSLSSNRISSELPLWIRRTLADEDVQNITYDAETNTLSFLNPVTLKDTIVLPDEDSTVLNLNGNIITASAGKNAISGGTGSNVNLSLISGDEHGTIQTCGDDGTGKVAAVIDFSNTTGESSITVVDTSVNGGDANDGLDGGDGILASNTTLVQIDDKATVNGGKGGYSSTSDGGNGGTGIKGGKVVVTTTATVTGGNGGDSLNDNGGNGGAAIANVVSVTSTGTVAGGNGGNGPVQGGTAGVAGIEDGTNGVAGTNHIHSWGYEADGNQVFAYCVEGDESCSYYGSSTSHEKALKLTLKLATSMEYTGNAYNSAAVLNEITAVTQQAAGEIKYYATDSNGLKTGSAIAAPSALGDYIAEVTIAGKTASASFSIVRKKQKNIRLAMDDYTYGGEVSVPSISGACENPTVTYYYSKENKNTEGTLWNNIGSETLDADTYYMYAEVSQTAYYKAFTTPAVMFKVNPTTMTNVSSSAIKAVYDKQQYSISVDGYPSGATVEYGLTAGEYSSENPSFTDVKNAPYTVYYKVTHKNYKPFEGSSTVTITPKKVNLEWTNTSLTYNQKEQLPKATVVAADLISGDECKLNITGAAINVGSTYVATATSENDNYEIDSSTKTQQYSIVPKSIQLCDVKLDGANNIYDYSGSPIVPVITVKDNDTDLVVGANKDYTVKGIASAQGVSAYAFTIVGQGNYKDELKVDWSIVDHRAPSGTIEIAKDSWNSFMNTITFGLFFKDTQSVTITASEAADESGVDKIYYYISETECSKQALAELDAAKWTEIASGSSFNIEPNKQLIIYAKLVDTAGNIGYISSDGIVLDSIKPTITGVLDQKTYCSAKTITVKDDNLDRVVINDKEVSLTDGSYTLAANGTTYKITAYDKSGNTTTVTVKIEAQHVYGAWVIVKQPTTTQTGLRERTCTCEGCSYKVTEVIPKLSTNTIPEKTLQKNALKMNAGLKVDQKKKVINVKWGKITTASKYEIYVQYCGKVFTKNSMYTVRNANKNKIAITKINKKKINLKKNYKVYVVAYKKINGKMVKIGSTIDAHIVGRLNKTSTNAKSIKLVKQSFTLSKGKTAKVKAKTILVAPKKKQLSDQHAKEFRYSTTNDNVATVTSDGVITAIGKGSCVVYVYARNGYAKAVKVKVTE